MARSSKAAISARWRSLNSTGRLLASAGDPFYTTYLRSSAKPFQALPIVASGAFDHSGLAQDALALMCASHHGTEEHVAVCQRILDASGLDVSALRCGVHWPIDEEATRRLAAAGLTPDLRHNNCSGKHSGMLTLATFWGCADSDYTDPHHPVQAAILQGLAGLVSLPAGDILVAPDNCTVPAFALPLANAALAYARLIDPAAPPEAGRIVAAMQAYPHLISGRGALDDTLMRAGAGALVAKGGAEGYQGIGIRTPDGLSLGFTLKMADGAGRAKGPVIYAVLERLGLVNQDVLASLESLRCPEVRNHRQVVVGEMRPAFELTVYDPPLEFVS